MAWEFSRYFSLFSALLLVGFMQRHDLQSSKLFMPGLAKIILYWRIILCIFCIYLVLMPTASSPFLKSRVFLLAEKHVFVLSLHKMLIQTFIPYLFLEESDMSSLSLKHVPELAMNWAARTIWEPRKRSAVPDSFFQLFPGKILIQETNLENFKIEEQPRNVDKNINGL